MCGGVYEEYFDLNDQIGQLESKIEKMYELQIPFFIVDKELKKLRELKEEKQNENVHSAN